MMGTCLTRLKMVSLYLTLYLEMQDLLFWRNISEKLKRLRMSFKEHKFSSRSFRLTISSLLSNPKET